MFCFVQIESGLRSCELVENICICTDPYSNHVTALVSPNHRALKDLAAALSKSDLTIERLCDDASIASRVLEALTATGTALGFKPKELPVQVTLVPEEWNASSNLLTAAFKLKRKAVYDAYRDKIAHMFADGNRISPRAIG